MAQGLQDSYSDYLGRLTYKELNSEDYTKVSQIVANTTADKWDYAIEGYAKSQNISYQEAKDRFALAININQAADIAGILYGLKGSGGGSGSISTSAASSLKQILSKYNEFKQNIANSTKGNNDALAMAGAGNVNGSSNGSGLSSNTHLSTGSGGKGKQPYQPNQGAVGNMGEFFNKPGFGSQMKDSAQKTSQVFQGQSVYQAKKPVGDYIAKGDKYYLDGLHKDHIEVFDSKGKVKAVLNIDGSYNSAKSQAAVKEGRRIPK